LPWGIAGTGSSMVTGEVKLLLHQVELDEGEFAEKR
jgi:hypothetical protein